MVIWFYRASTLFTALLLAEEPLRPAEKLLKSHYGVKALAALAALVILGFGMVFLTYLGGRYTRRYMNSTFRPPPPDPDQEDWARQTTTPNPKISPDNLD
jgi:hypothetical protein